jgi:hypothetical protein
MYYAFCSLKSNGSIYYAGVDTLGIMGMIDASECPPTYGACEFSCSYFNFAYIYYFLLGFFKMYFTFIPLVALSDVRGFLDQGYKSFRNNDGDLSNLVRLIQ